jgi:DNA-binding CsgD family transcriptional regulator
VRTCDPSAKKISDFLNRGAFHRLGIYAENYRRTGVEHQMTFMIESRPKPAPATIAIALDRGRGERDFSERDRLVLNVLRPYLEGAHANVETLAAMRRRGSTTGERPETRLFETIVLGRGAQRAISRRARRWLAEYFDDMPVRGNELPDTLQRWARQQVAGLESIDTMSPPPAPFVVEHERRLSIRLILNSPDNILILEEEQTAPDLAALERLGLTPREAQVLHWMAEGKTNPEIGIILGASHRTVAKHVQTIHSKLHVETRMAAAAVARGQS